MYYLRLVTNLLDKDEVTQLMTYETFCRNCSLSGGLPLEARKTMQRASGLAGFQNSLSKRPTPICKECATKLSAGPLKSWKLYGGQVCCGELAVVNFRCTFPFRKLQHGRDHDCDKLIGM